MGEGEKISYWQNPRDNNWVSSWIIWNLLIQKVREIEKMQLRFIWDLFNKFDKKWNRYHYKCTINFFNLKNFFCNTALGDYHKLNPFAPNAPFL